MHAINIVSVVRPCPGATCPVSVSLRVPLGLLTLSVWVSLHGTAGTELFVEASQVWVSDALQLGRGQSSFQGRAGWVLGLSSRGIERDLAYVSKMPSSCSSSWTAFPRKALAL